MPYSVSRVAQKDQADKDQADTFRPDRRPEPPTRPGLLRAMAWIAAAALSCVVLVSVTFQLVDRPVATWAHDHLGDKLLPLFTAPYDTHPLVIGPFSLMAGPAEVLAPIAIITFAVLAVLAASGRRVTMRRRIILTLVLAILVALQINSHLKLIFGRTWPESWLGNNPSWIHDGVFGFFPFHGGRGWGSFPSGHTTVITTPATILWVVWPRLRLLWVAAVLCVIIGLVGADYHFVSDTIGGVYLGVAVGLSMVALTLSRGDRLDWSMLRAPLAGETQRQD